MPFVVVYDANALYPNVQRDLLIRIATAGLVQAKWTSQILDEMAAARQRRNPDLDPAKLVHLRDRMNAAVADCIVMGYEQLIEGLKLPDPKDRHVLAAAMAETATVDDVLTELEYVGLVRSVAALGCRLLFDGKRFEVAQNRHTVEPAMDHFRCCADFA